MRILLYRGLYPPRRSQHHLWEPPGTVSWSIPSLAANGGSVDFQLAAQVAAAAPAGTIGNTASATVDSVFTSSNTVTINC